ncbi:copper resistance CopC family protein [Ornithinimicrobium cerasi]|uniref:CopC domain-containing protein n=1 Tax=Ornithinimicrobium cerasi TaxID=2248773 RepID=A0A285VX54_9MICO|nr:copper resistance CopC family protein [Ornithinimicrobium cerasi]SOC57241.1 hypothetical protein SAMN05421879_11169 [Ornithinimicrobium cerasi]
MSRLLRVAVLALLSLFLLAPPAAQAHDELIASDPQDGATLDDAPDEVVLTFSGRISELGAQVVLEDATGASLVEGGPLVDGEEVEQDLADLAAGAYTVLWRVTSEDGHPISGQLSFTVTEDDDDSPDGTSSGAPATATEEGTTAATPPPTSAAATPEPTTSATPAPATGTTSESLDDGAGLPVWAWVVLALGVLGLLALLGRTWARGRA